MSIGFAAQSIRPSWTRFREWANRRPSRYRRGLAMEAKTCKGGWSTRLSFPMRDGVGSRCVQKHQHSELRLKQDIMAHTLKRFMFFLPWASCSPHQSMCREPDISKVDQVSTFIPLREGLRPKATAFTFGSASPTCMLQSCSRLSMTLHNP